MKRRSSTRCYVGDERCKITKPPLPRFFRTFMSWLEDARPRLLLSVQIARIRRTFIELSISGFGGCITASVCRSGRKGSSVSISVRVQWNGDDVDGFFDLDVNTRRTKDGYVCVECPSDSAENYPTIEALWIAHLFEALLEFVNEKLATADCLAIHFRHGSSWALLTTTPKELGESCVAVVAG